VLLVDDSLDDRDVYSQYLAFRRCRVVTARSGEEGVDSALRLRPDVVVMDVDLGRSSGLEAARQLKAAPSTAGIPVIVLSCHDEEELRREAWAAGCATYLSKPCLPEALFSEIRRVTSLPS
jgi:CheY-like chemotaxis protein